MFELCKFVGHCGGRRTRLPGIERNGRTLALNHERCFLLRRDLSWRHILGRRRLRGAPCQQRVITSKRYAQAEQDGKHGSSRLPPPSCFARGLSPGREGALVE